MYGYIYSEYFIYSFIIFFIELVDLKKNLIDL